MSLADNIGNSLVRKLASDDEEPLATSLCDLNGSDMSKGNIADVYPEECTGGRQLFLGLALDQISHTSVGSVHRIERVEVMNDRSKYQGRVDRRQIEVGLFLLNELPSSLLRKSLE